MRSLSTAILNKYTSFYDDEFALHIAYTSATVAWNVSTYLNLAVMCLLAWIVPGSYFYATALLLLPTIIGSAAAQSYSRSYLPTPAPTKKIIPIKNFLFALTFVAIWLAGGWFRGALMSSYAAGALIGILGAAVTMPWMAKRQHAKDTKRLSADAE